MSEYSDHIIVTLGAAFELANTITAAAQAAQAAGQAGVELSVLQQAFSALDMAEAELDAAIDAAE